MLLPWVIFSLSYFGTPIPNSVTAKRYAYLIEPGSALVRLIQTYSTPFFEFDTFGSLGAMVGAVVYLTLSLFALVYTARKLPRLLPLLIYPWLYLLVFSLLNPLIFRWYMAPPLPALMLGIVIGAWSIVSRPLRKQPRAALRAVIVGVIGCRLAVHVDQRLDAAPGSRAGSPRAENGVARASNCSISRWANICATTSA